jgi:hypothetical protein
VLAPLTMATLGSLTAHQLFVCATVTRTVRLHEHHGGALRGALFGALRDRFCVRQDLPSCQPCTLHAVCPISALVATVDDVSPRGADVPRPFALEPPLDGRAEHRPGHDYRFGLTLFGRALEYLPYALVGLQDLGAAGFGLRGADGPGRLRLDRVEAWHPLTSRRDVVYAAARPGAGAGGSAVRLPAMPVTHAHVLARAGRWLGRDRVTLRLLTPLRLVSEQRPVQRLEFGVFLRRLAGRLEALALRYGAPGAVPLGAAGAAALGEAADAVRVVDDRTRWIDVQSYSARQDRRLPVGGLIGEVTFAGEPEGLARLLPWLVWGEIAHAGKDATRGNGWYRLLEP